MPTKTIKLKDESVSLEKLAADKIPKHVLVAVDETTLILDKEWEYSKSRIRFFVIDRYLTIDGRLRFPLKLNKITLGFLVGLSASIWLIGKLVVVNWPTIQTLINVP